MHLRTQTNVPARVNLSVMRAGGLPAISAGSSASPSAQSTARSHTAAATASAAVPPAAHSHSHNHSDEASSGAAAAASVAASGGAALAAPLPGESNHSPSGVGSSIVGSGVLLPMQASHSTSAASLQSPPPPPPPNAHTHSGRKAARDRSRDRPRHRDRGDRDSKEQSAGSSFGVGGVRLEEDLLECRETIARKDEYIAGLQRNCETLSALCAKHMQQVTLLKGDLDRVSGEKYLLESDGQRFASNEALAARLLRENEELQSERRQLQGAVEALQAKVYATQSQLSELADQKQDAAADLARERSLHANLRLEVDELRQLMMADHAGGAAGGRGTGGAGGSGGGGGGSASVKAAQGEIERKILTLKSEYESNKSALESLQLAHKSLQLAHTKAGNVAARTQHEKESLEQDNQRLKKGLALLRKEHAESRDIAAVHAQQNVELRAAYDLLISEHAHCRTRLPALESSLRSSEKQRASLKKQFDEAWSTKEDLLLQLEEVKAEAELRAKQLEIMKAPGAAPAPAAPTGPSAAERSARDEVSRLQTERAELLRQVEELQHRRDTLERSLAESDASLQRWQTKYEAASKEKAGLAQELEATEAESRRLAAALKAATSGEQGSRDAMQAALRDAQAQLAEAASASQTELAAARKGAAEAAAAAAASQSAATTARDALAAQARTHAAELAESRRRAEESDRAAAASKQALAAAQRRAAELESSHAAESRLSASDLAQLARRESELQSTVAKLIVNEEASEASFTCFACLSVFTKPVTCIPCGHSYCVACIEQTHTCTQCRPPVQVTYYSNELLEELCSRFVFRKQALQTLKDMTAQTIVKLAS